MDGNIFLMIVICATTPFAFLGLVVWTKHRERVLAAGADQNAERATQNAALNELLAQRVEILERIVTDKGYDVAAQIENLRDRSQIDHRVS